MVPMLTCGLVRSNLAFATVVLLWILCFVPAAAGGATSCRSGRATGLFAGRLRDDLLGDVRGNLVVGVELHGVARPALGLRPQVADVAEHLRQRHQGADDAAATALLHRLDDATAGVEVTDDVTHVLLWGDDLDGHHGLEQRRVRPAGPPPQAPRTR